MSNLTNLVTEQFNELNTSYDNQKKQTQAKFIHKQQECEVEHKEAIAQLNIELKSNEVQLLNLIRKIEDKRGSMVTVEELASVLTLIADPINATNPALEDAVDVDVDVKSSEKSASKSKKATSSSSKEKVKSKNITTSKDESKNITTSSKDNHKDNHKDNPKDIIKSSDTSKDTSTSIPKPAPKYKGRYYR